MENYEVIDFKKNLDALNTPWVESPFFSKNIESLTLSNHEIELAKNFNSKGYVIFDLGISILFIEE